MKRASSSVRRHQGGTLGPSDKRAHLGSSALCRAAGTGATCTCSGTSLSHPAA
jgi:hypothetical protein